MNNSELFEFLPSMVQDERSLTYTMPSPDRHYLEVIYATCGLWGGFMKLFLFYNILKEKISERPINILILIDQAVDFVGSTFLITNTIVKVIFILTSGVRIIKFF